MQEKIIEIKYKMFENKLHMRYIEMTQLNQITWNVVELVMKNNDLLKHASMFIDELKYNFKYWLNKFTI